MEEQILKLANETAKSNFMLFTDYDADEPITDLPTALTVIIEDTAEQYGTVGEEFNGLEIYEYLKTIIKDD